MAAFEAAVPLTLPLDGVPADFAGVQQLVVAPPLGAPISPELNEPPTLALALVGVAAVAMFRGLHKRMTRRSAPAASVQLATRKNAPAAKSRSGGKKRQQGRKPIKPRRRAA